MNTAIKTPSALDMLREMFPQKMRIGTADIAKVLGYHPHSIRNAVHQKRFGIPTYIDGKNLYADLRDVAIYLDKLRTPKGRPTKASTFAAK